MTSKKKQRDFNSKMLMYNATCVPLALAGWLPPWIAGLGMALSSLFVVCNALRLRR